MKLYPKLIYHIITELTILLYVSTVIYTILLTQGLYQSADDFALNLAILTKKLK